MPKLEGDQTEYGTLLVLGPVVSGIINSSTKTITFSEGARFEFSIGWGILGKKIEGKSRSIHFINSEKIELQGELWSQSGTIVKTLDQLLQSVADRNNHRAARFSYTRASRGIEVVSS